MLKYKHLFFDLDHTLWDFATNEQHTLSHLFIKYKLDQYFENFESFLETYQPINENLWLQYRNREVTKKYLSVNRFHHTFLTKGLDDAAMAEQFGNDFIAINATQTALVPHTIEVLNYLEKKYTLHIITNGFVETQYVKLDGSGLSHYFKKIFISEQVGHQKPKRAFFEYAVKSCNARKSESLVIGDNLEADIIGAREFGLDQVFFNPHGTIHQEKITKEISSLKELMQWL